MAAAWLSVLTVSLCLLVVVIGYDELPLASSRAQQGTLGKDVGGRRLADNREAVLTAPPKWEWKPSAEGSHERRGASRRKRDGGVPSKGPSKKSPPAQETRAGVVSTSLGLILGGKMAKPSPTVAPSPTSREKVGALASKGAALLKGPKPAAPSAAPETNAKGASDATEGSPGGGRHFVSKGIPVAANISSDANLIGKENATVPLTEARNVSATTEYWPWLYDHATDTPQTEGATASTLAQWLEGKNKGKGGMSPTTVESWIRGLSTPSSRPWADNLDVSTAGEATETHQPVPRAKWKSGFSSPKATTSGPWLDKTSQALVEDDDASTAAAGQVSSTEKTAGKGRGVADPRFGGANAGPATAAPGTTAAVRPAPGTSPRGAPDLLGKCLLAISLLALVAAVFIVTTTVLAILLWRRNRAYKKNCGNHTEMVCISSLLAAEEAEEAAQRQPRAKRVKALGESNGLETEMDNLTLNSFLPDH